MANEIVIMPPLRKGLLKTRHHWTVRSATESDDDASTSATDDNASDVSLYEDSNPDSTDLSENKAQQYGINPLLVGPHSTIHILRDTARKINAHLPRKEKIRIKQCKQDLLDTLRDILDVPQDDCVPRQEMVYVPKELYPVDRGYNTAKRWLKQGNDGLSERSFEDCSCKRCCGLPWPYIDQDESESFEPHIQPPPKIPRIRSVEEAIQQVQDGTIDEFKKMYYNSLHWHAVKKTYCERMVGSCPCNELIVLYQLIRICYFLLYRNFMKHTKSVEMICNAYIENTMEI
jgi:hypothetical protein